MPTSKSALKGRKSGCDNAPYDQFTVWRPGAGIGHPINSQSFFRPFRAPPPSLSHPGLAAWATFLGRFRLHTTPSRTTCQFLADTGNYLCMPIPLSLSGKVALITGGSRGIGAAAVRMFVAAGARVLFNYEKAKAPAEQLVKELGRTTARPWPAIFQARRRRRNWSRQR